MQDIPEVILNFDEKSAGFQIQFVNFNGFNLGLEDILRDFNGSMISRGLLKTAQMAVNNYLKSLVDRNLLYMYDGKWKTRQIFEVGDLIAVDHYKVDPSNRSKNVFEKDVGMCVYAQDNLYKFNFAGNTQEFNLFEMSRLGAVKM
jgi:hypothetical protein